MSGRSRIRAYMKNSGKAKWGNATESPEQLHGRKGSRHLSPEKLDDLGIFHHEQFLHLKNLRDIEKAIAYGIRALYLTLEGDPNLSSRYSNLGWYYSDRFRHLGKLEDLEKALEHRSHAVKLTPHDDPDLSGRHTRLASSYTDRFLRLGELGDLERSIEHDSYALELTAKDKPDFLYCLSNLGISYRYRYRRLGDLDDLERALGYHSHALKLIPKGHYDLPKMHAILGTSYSERFQRLGKLGDLEKSVEHRLHGLELTPEGDPDWPCRCNNLGMSYRDRFRRLDDLDDLEKSIGYCSRALEMTSEPDPELPIYHANLGHSYSYRFQRLGELEDLRTALEHHNHALTLTPEGHFDLQYRHANLGSIYSIRFRRLGDLDDLEKSIEHLRHALALTPGDHPNLSSWHASLATSYSSRFEHLGEQEDIEKSIEHGYHALTLTPTGHPNLPNRYETLGTSYTYRFRHLGELDDLEKSINNYSRAVELTTGDDPNLPRGLTNLGTSYRDKSRHSGDLGDIEKALKHHSHALALTPKGHPDLPNRHADLSASYSDRFRLLGEPADLERAIEQDSHALELTPDGHPDLPDRYYDHAETFFLQYELTGDRSHLKVSLDYFRRATRMLNGAPRTIFQCALHWADLASTHSSLNCIEAYQTAIDLLPHFIWLGATTNQRYRDLSTTENLAVSSAYAAILHSDHKLALEWLEHTRCVVWNQTLLLRSPLDQLDSSHPELAIRLQSVSKQLHEASSVPEVQALNSAPNAEQIGQQRRRLAKEYNDLLTKVHKIPGFQDFLQPVKSAGLVRAARNGPVVVINCHRDRCDALIIIPGQTDIKHVPLHGFTEEKAQSARSGLETSLRRKGLRQRGVKLMHQQPEPKDCIQSVLLTLWKDVVKPILDFLEFTNDLSIDGLPHITWCPTGALSFLPLHAAGDYDQPRSRVFDYVVSSYTPTVTALLASAPSTLKHTPRVLAIGQAKTPGHNPLPGTTRELAYLKVHTQEQAEYSQLIDNKATTAAVLEAMEQHDWVHLACHAHQNVVDPTRSGFYLHDGTLDLASINRRSFKNKGLAFLSACQTATGDEKLPDEAIHLASGMLMAGYPSVIATMWSVVDADAPFIADKVYTELMRDRKVGNGEAGRALHCAVAALRDELGEQQFARWVPYIHIGS
ncbi:hypothetical protein OPQ81_000930 [Rhizoctonia solani]|nr:hypothetical protein OPQ81_000930 [Rhizoctonia solani]